MTRHDYNCSTNFNQFHLIRIWDTYPHINDGLGGKSCILVKEFVFSDVVAIIP